MKKMLATLVLVSPLLLAGGGEYRILPVDPEEQHPLPQHTIEVPQPWNWTLILTGLFGTLTASVPGYFTYKTVKARRAVKREE